MSYLTNIIAFFVAISVICTNLTANISLSGGAKAKISNPLVSDFTSYAFENASLLSGKEMTPALTEDITNIIEGGLYIGYLGIDELNPASVTLIQKFDEFGYGIKIEGVSDDLFRDISATAAFGYQITEDISVGGSYQYSSFVPTGYEAIDYHVVDLSMSVELSNSSYMYFIASDLLDDRIAESQSEFITGRELLVGYLYSNDKYFGGLDAQVSEARGGVSPFVGVYLIDELRLYLKGHSITRSLSIGSALQLDRFLLSSEVIYSDRIGADFYFTIGWIF